MHIIHRSSRAGRTRSLVTWLTLVCIVIGPTTGTGWPAGGSTSRLAAQAAGTAARPATPAAGTQARPATPQTPAPLTSAPKPVTPAQTVAPPRAQVQTASAPAAPPADGGWPKNFVTKSKSRLTLYQPQIASWPDHKKMTMYIAAQYVQPMAVKPALGVLTVTSNTNVALADRLVRFDDFDITEANFVTMDRDAQRNLIAEVKDSVPADARTIGLDRVMAMMDTSAIVPKNVEGLKNDPPVIFYSQTPAVLVNIDGDPIWSPITGNELRFAVNTNWDLFEHQPSKNYFLRLDRGWLVATDVKGPWRAAGRLPDSFSKLPADNNWTEVRAAIPGRTIPTVPQVLVSTTPAELIVTTGVPQYLAVTGTDLVWLSNTESDVFRLKRDGPVYYLVSGRWFTSAQFTGPWTFATPTLPADFMKIPLEHPRSRVLASVPGTRQASEAVMLAQIPQTARVKKSEVQAPAVSYNGDPQFEAIPSTNGVARAVNTDKQILLVSNTYYMCFEGVWFRSTSASGPWEVAVSIPPQIYAIPASSPAHNVTYVTIEEDDDDEWVTFAAAAAYTGTMVAWGCTMWGTGWYYPPYYYGGIYYPFYPTYGYGAWYNPWTGGYGRAGAIYGPYGGAGFVSRYNPATGTYSRGAVAYGPGGMRGAGSAYNPWTGASGVTRQGSNVYGSWGSTAVQRGDDWAQTSRVTNRATGTTTRVTRSDEGGAITRNTPGPGGGGVARTDGGDVYAGRDGNVYRNTGDGWQRYGGDGNWNNVDRPQPVDRGGATAGTLSGETRDQLNGDRAGRADGATRTRDLGTVQRGGTTNRGSGTYRPNGGGARSVPRGGGGGFRGGGGRRR